MENPVSPCKLARMPEMIRFRVSVKKPAKRKDRNSPCLYGDISFGEAQNEPRYFSWGALPSSLGPRSASSAPE